MFDWAIENGLELNVRNTYAMIFGSNIWISNFVYTASKEPWSINDINKIYATLNFHYRSLNALVWKQLIQSLALPLFDYTSITLMNLDKIKALALQTAHNACVRFIFENIPRIPTTNIPTHLTHWRLYLGWLSDTEDHRLKLATLAYSVLTEQYLLCTIKHLYLICIVYNK